MADNEITITGDAASAVRELQKLLDANEKLERKIESLVKTGQRQGHEEAKRLREAAKLTKDNETSLERYNRKVAESKRLLDAGHISQETHNRELIKQRELLRGTGDTLDRFPGGFSKLRASGVAAITGVTSVAAILNKALDDTVRKMERVRDANIDAQQSLGQVRQNFTPDATVSREQFDERVNQAAEVTGASVEQVTQALGPTLSARGANSNEWAFKATEAALKFTDNDVGSAAGLSGAIGDFSRLGNDDPEAIAGFLAKSQQASRMTSIAQLAKTGAPVANSLAATGTSAEQSMELFTTLTRLNADPTGESTSTAMIQLSEKLGKDKKLTGSTAERIAQLQQNPEMAEKFLSANTFEAKATAGIRQLLRGEESAMAVLEESRKLIPSLDAGANPVNRKAFAEAVEFNRGKGTPAGAVAEAEKRSKTNIQDFDLDKNSVDATVAEIREIMTDTLDRINIPNALDFSSRILHAKAFDVTQMMAGDDDDAKLTNATAAARSSLKQVLVGDHQSPRDVELIQKQLDALDALYREIKGLRTDQNKNAQLGNAIAVQNSNKQVGATLKSKPVVSPLTTESGR